MHGFRLSNEKIQTEQNGPQKVVMGFVHYILQMVLKLKPIHCQSCIWATIQKDKKLDDLFKHPLPAKKTQSEEGEMEIGIIN